MLGFSTAKMTGVVVGVLAIIIGLFMLWHEATRAAHAEDQLAQQKAITASQKQQYDNIVVQLQAEATESRAEATHYAGIITQLDSVQVTAQCANSPAMQQLLNILHSNGRSAASRCSCQPAPVPSPAGHTGEYQ